LAAAAGRRTVIAVAAALATRARHGRPPAHSVGLSPTRSCGRHRPGAGLTPSCAGVPAWRCLRYHLDHWEHLIVVEEALPRESITDALPMCVGGESGCLPEDVGGTHGLRGVPDRAEQPVPPRAQRRLGATSTRPPSTCIASTGAWPVTANAIPIVLHRPRAGPTNTARPIVREVQADFDT
jgi:hypothetical protein